MKGGDKVMTLKAARVNAGYTQLDVAKRMDIAVTTLSAWENGQNSIKADDFKRLCELYGERMDDIILPTESTK